MAIAWFYQKYRYLRISTINIMTDISGIIVATSQALAESTHQSLFNAILLIDSVLPTCRVSPRARLIKSSRARLISRHKTLLTQSTEEDFMFLPITGSMAKRVYHQTSGEITIIQDKRGRCQGILVHRDMKQYVTVAIEIIAHNDNESFGIRQAAKTSLLKIKKECEKNQ